MDERADKKDYEVSFLVRDEREVPIVLEHLGRLGAELTLEGAVERIYLAYKIKRETHAYFGYFHFRIHPEAIAELTQALTTDARLLRFLIVSPPLGKSRSKVGPRVRERGPSKPLEVREMPPLPISNEALEKKIEEILQG